MTQNTQLTLRDLHIGQTATITSVGGEGSLRQHFLDMGVIPGAEVTLVKYAPMGDPMELLIHGYELTLRLADAEKIEIANAHQAAEKPGKADSETQQKRLMRRNRRPSSRAVRAELSLPQRKRSIRDWARAESITPRQMNILCRRILS